MFAFIFHGCGLVAVPIARFARVLLGGGTDWHPPRVVKAEHGVRTRVVRDRLFRRSELGCFGASEVESMELVGRQGKMDFRNCGKG